MLLLSGELFTVFETPRKVTKEGQEYGGDHRVQVMAMIPMEGGTEKAELVDIKVNDVTLYKGRERQPVQIPVGAFAPGKNQIRFFESGMPIFSRGESASAAS